MDTVLRGRERRAGAGKKGRREHAPGDRATGRVPARRRLSSLGGSGLVSGPSRARVAPYRPGRPSRRRASPASVLQRLVAWLVWPVVLGLPPLLFNLRVGFGLEGLHAVIHLVVGLPIAWIAGAVLAILVTARACLVMPYAAGAWSTGFLLFHWLMQILLGLALEDVVDPRGTTVPSPLERWGLTQRTADEVSMVAFHGAWIGALAALIAAMVELGTVHRRRPQHPPATPAG